MIVAIFVSVSSKLSVWQAKESSLTKSVDEKRFLDGQEELDSLYSN